MQIFCNAILNKRVNVDIFEISFIFLQIKKIVVTIINAKFLGEGVNRTFIFIRGKEEFSFFLYKLLNDKEFLFCIRFLWRSHNKGIRISQSDAKIFFLF